MHKRRTPAQWSDLWGLAVDRFAKRARSSSDPVERLKSERLADAAGRRRLLALARWAEFDGWRLQAARLREAAATVSYSEGRR